MHRAILNAAEERVVTNGDRRRGDGGEIGKEEGLGAVHR